MSEPTEHSHQVVVAYQVVVNHEEQYSVWFADSDPPAGWRPEGTVGSRQACLDHIASVWTDMRPLTVRRAMDAEPATGSRL